MPRFLPISLRRTLSIAGLLSLFVATGRAQAPVNDECSGAIPIPLTAACTLVTGSVAGATESMPPNLACSGGSGAIADVWFSFVAASAGQDINVTATLRNFVVEVFSGPCATLTPLVCRNSRDPFQATGLTPGQTYYIRVYGIAALPPPTSNPAAAFDICLTSAPPNDEPCNALALPLTQAGTPAQPVTSTTAGATTSMQPMVALPGCGNSSDPRDLSNPRDVWFTFKALNSFVSLTLNGSSATRLRLFTTPSCANGPLTMVDCQTRSGTSPSPMLLTGLTPGQTYYLAVSGNGTAPPAGPFTIAGSTLLAARGQAEAGALVVFPNPSASGRLTLRLSAPTPGGEATLLNALGQQVLQQRFSRGTTEQTVPTQGMAKGIYTLRVTTGNSTLTRKVVLE